MWTESMLDSPSLTRRSLIASLAGGMGAIPLTMLWGAEESAANRPVASLNGGIHFPAKVKRIVQLFMNGGASPMDTFDYKPELEKGHGKPFDPGAGVHVEAPTSAPGNLMKSPFPFQQHGQCGRWVSSLFPELAKRVDDMAFLMAMESKTNVHGPGSYLMNTGFLLPGFPCMGSWVSFALGRLSDNLPTFVALPDPRGLPYNQKGNFSSGFLPVAHSATVINAGSETPINDLRAPASAKFITQQSELETHSLLNRMNRRHQEERPGDSRLDARISSYELAARMQLAAPELFDLSQESKATQDLYGVGDAVTADFGKRCLLARRMLERGVRFVQVWSGAGGPSNNWDNHTDIITELPKMTSSTDRPISALLQDLKARGMFEDTLVIWSTEFGRMPFTQGATGRDHNGGTFVGWLAGAGVKGGAASGESDPWAWKTAENKCTTYDFHATVLHLLGIDHEKMTYRHNGANRRLTDVHGHVVKEILS
jgi:hypothetical protein